MEHWIEQKASEITGGRVLAEWQDWGAFGADVRHYVPVAAAQYLDSERLVIRVEVLSQAAEATSREQVEAIDALAALPGMSRDDVLDESKRLIGGDRAQTYGDAGESFGRIGALWSALLGIEVTATDVARCMIAMKLSRLHGTPGHADSWVDAAGYAALGAEIAGARL